MRQRPVVSLVLLVALCAPARALHVHPAHDADHHPLLHAHFGVHARGVPVSSLAEHSSDATYLDTVAWVAASIDLAVHLIAVNVDAHGLSDDRTATFVWWGDSEGSVHDPPVSTPGLRAPPALLV